VAAEVVVLAVGQRLLQGPPPEDVDAHRGQVGRLLAAREPRLQAREAIGRRLLVEVDDAPGVVDAHDAERRGLLGRDVLHGDGGVGARLAVGAQHLLEVHPVQLIARKDDDVVPVLVADVAHAAADGVGGPLEPVRALLGLIRGHRGDEARGEDVELVGAAQVLVQALRLILGQHVDASDVGVQAIAHRHVDDPVLATDGNGRLGSIEGQGKESAPAATAQDDSDDVVHVASYYLR
jgi:hypothetical protein